jgi:cytochrome c-type protein NapB
VNVKTTIVTVSIVILAIGCSVLDRDSGTEPGTPVADSELGLSKASVFEVTAPEPVVWKGDIPGTNKLLPRANKEAPPRIPHDTRDQLPITFEDNVCIECHTEKDPEDKTPRIPESHYVDLRRAPGKVAGRVEGARYQCMACHVPQSGAPPLVRNGSSR